MSRKLRDGYVVEGVTISIAIAKLGSGKGMSLVLITSDVLRRSCWRMLSWWCYFNSQSVLRRVASRVAAIISSTVDHAWNRPRKTCLWCKGIVTICFNGQCTYTHHSVWMPRRYRYIA